MADSAPVSSAGPPTTPGGQPVPADDGVLVGEQRDLGVPDVEQPGGQPGQPVVRGGPGHLDDQAAGGGDPVRIAQRVGLGPRSASGELATRRPPSLVTRAGRRTAGTMLTRPHRTRMTGTTVRRGV